METTWHYENLTVYYQMCKYACQSAETVDRVKLIQLLMIRDFKYSNGSGATRKFEGMEVV